MGSELRRLQHAIKVGEPWIPIVRYSIPLSVTCPTLSHAAMVGPDRGRSYRKVDAGNPARIAPLLMSAYGLTEREEVALLVLQGNSTAHRHPTMLGHLGTSRAKW